MNFVHCFMLYLMIDCIAFSPFGVVHLHSVMIHCGLHLPHL